MTKEAKSGNGGVARRPASSAKLAQLFADADNEHDNLKALEEMRLDAEKGMFMFDGAIQLLLKQQEDSLLSGSCAICRRHFGSRRLLQQCTNLLQSKRDTVQRLRNDEAASLYDSCVAAMNEIRSEHDVPSLNPPRLAFYLRTGELSEWRQQKVDCMTNMACFACTRGFTAEEFAAFLRRVDHRAAAMERELHMHPKFCNIPALPMPTLEKEEAHNIKFSNSSSPTAVTLVQEDIPVPVMHTKRMRWSDDPNDILASAGPSELSI